ncbi:MAG: sulfite oxidase, partial [Rubrobacteraceae bacterium]
MTRYDKDRAMITHEEEPFNAESPPKMLSQNFLADNNFFFSRNHGSIPNVDETNYRLKVDGMVDTPLELSMQDLREFPKREIIAVMQCAGNRREGLMEIAEIPGETPWGAGAIGNAGWAGVSLREVLLAAGIQDGARHAAFLGLDEVEGDGGDLNYGGSIPVGKALAPETLLAYEMNDEILPIEHGFPLRIVAPGYYGARSVKWLSRITLQEQPSDNHFQVNEYKLFAPGVTAETEGSHEGLMLGEMQVNAVICTQQDGASTESGRTSVRGYAVAGGGRRVERVDVSSDDGKSWIQAELLQGVDEPWAWTFWETDGYLTRGEHRIVARAVDSSAATQPSTAAEVWNFKG